MDQQQTISLAFVSKLRAKMQKHNFMLSYQGHFSQDITKALLTITENKLEMEGTETGLKKKVFNVMVECLQNICKHKDEDMNNKSALFMIGKTEDHYVIYSGNVIANKKVMWLKDKLLAINTMNKEDLKELYRSLISSTELSSGGNAGLGLIDIARKSGNTLDFDFEKMNDEFSFFSLKTIITNVN